MINFSRYVVLMMAEFKGADLSPKDYDEMVDFRRANNSLHLCMFCSHKSACKLAVPSTKVVSCRKFNVGIIK